MSCASWSLSSPILFILVYSLTWSKFFIFISLYLSPCFSLSCLLFIIKWTRTISSFDSFIWIKQCFRFKDSFISKLAKRDHIIHVIFEWPSLLKVKQHWFENLKEHDSTTQHMERLNNKIRERLNNTTIEKDSKRLDKLKTRQLKRTQ